MNIGEKPRLLVGFSVGVNLVHSMAASAKKEGIWVDSLVYLSGNNPVTPVPSSRPDNVGHVVNLLTGGMMKKFGESSYAENVHLTDAWHFDAPMHVQTREALARELAQVAIAIPMPEPVDPQMPTVFDGEPTPRPVKRSLANKQDSWDFLHPVSRIKPARSKQDEAADSATTEVPANSHVQK